MRPTAAHLEKIPSLCLSLLLARAQLDAMRLERVRCQEATPPCSRPPPQAVVKHPESLQQAGSNGNSHTTTRIEPPHPAAMMATTTVYDHTTNDNSKYENCSNHTIFPATQHPHGHTIPTQPHHLSSQPHNTCTAMVTCGNPRVRGH